MNFNRSIDNIANYSSMYPDIMEQIKKKSEEMSTSEASYKLLQNLSNPTNLTNPLIVNSLSKRNKGRNRYNLPSLKGKRMINSNNNEIIPTKFISRSNSNIISGNNQNSLANDPFDFNNYQKLILKAEKDILEKHDKIRIKKIITKIERNTDDLKSLNTDKNKGFSAKNNLKRGEMDKIVNYDDIWEKLKRGKSLNSKRNKEVRISYGKFIPINKTIDISNNIRLLNYHYKNKNERLRKYLSMKNIEMKSTDKIIQKLENSKHYLGNKYKEDYKSYINFLNKTYDDEILKNDDILKQKSDIIHEINNIQRQIERLKNTKINIINWIYFQIQVKERKITLPIYYKYIIEDNIPYENINKISKGKYYLNITEYNKIVNLKKHCLYEKAEDFLGDLERIQMKSLTRINEDLELFSSEQYLKAELEELKSYNINVVTQYNKAYKRLIEELKYVKNENEHLEKKLYQEKMKKPITRTYKDNALIKKLAIFANMNSDDKGGDSFLRNDKPTIYYIAICLYYILMLRKFPELKNKQLVLDKEKSDEYNMLLIFKYAQDVIDILYKEKNYYLSNKIWREEYMRIKAEIDKELRREKNVVKVEMFKKIEDEKIEKFKQKLNKRYYKRMRKIDFDHFRKEKRAKNKSLDVNIKRQTKFEDFLDDI